MTIVENSAGLAECSKKAEGSIPFRPSTADPRHLNRHLGGLPDHSQEDGHQAVPSDLALRVASLESLLIEKGLVDPQALDLLVDAYEHKIGPRNGAKVVARAWVDAGYRARLLTDASTAIRGSPAGTSANRELPKANAAGL